MVLEPQLHVLRLELGEALAVVGAVELLCVLLNHVGRRVRVFGEPLLQFGDLGEWVDEHSAPLLALLGRHGRRVLVGRVGVVRLGQVAQRTRVQPAIERMRRSRRVHVVEVDGVREGGHGSHGVRLVGRGRLGTRGQGQHVLLLLWGRGSGGGRRVILRLSVVLHLLFYVQSVVVPLGVQLATATAPRALARPGTVQRVVALVVRV